MDASSSDDIDPDKKMRKPTGRANKNRKHERETELPKHPTIKEEESHKENSDSTTSSDKSYIFTEDEADITETTGTAKCKQKANTPKKRPGFKIASLNMRGCQKEGKDKMKMVVDWMRMNNITILALQETHQKTEAIEELNDRYKYLKFYGSGLSTASSGIMFIISENAGTPDETSFKNIECGRSGILSLKYGEQTLIMVNVYMPNDKTQQKEAIINLRRTLKNETKIKKDSELVILGDWNFVEDQVDRSPQHGR